jgi:hypothetical protein
VDLLATIKRLAFRRSLVFTGKARDEMDAAGITRDDAIEAIVNAHRIDKAMRSRSEFRSRPREYLCVIKGMTLDNMVLYTKGRIATDLDGELSYVVVSCKRSN